MANLPDHKTRTICVFCGTSLGKDDIYMKVANILGIELAARKINLIYGGGSLGLMGCVSTSALLGGSKVLGITPRALANPSIIGFTLGNELTVGSMHERIGNMMINADAFIALPGGLGTLEEVFNVASWAHLNMHHKPIGLLNINGFYDGLLAFLDHVVEQGFMSLPARRILISAPTVNQLLDKLQEFVPKPDPAMSMISWAFPSNKKAKKQEVEAKKQEVDLLLRL